MIYLKSTLAGLLAVLAAATLIIIVVIVYISIASVVADRSDRSDRMGPDFPWKTVDLAFSGPRDFWGRILLGVFPN
jgi:hypothetical protein